LALTTPSARPDGLGAALQQSLPHLDASLLLVLGVLLMLVFLALAGHWALGILLVATAGALLFVWRHSMMQRLGGFTGDTAGALVELTEASVLLVAVLLIAD
ncbi:adenosylcobinamide-GDP ribazoletransferase, partial [Halochromatium sp.]